MPLVLEQQYFDLFKPNTNILTIAASPLGHTVSDATKAKMALSQPTRIPVRITNTIDGWFKDFISINAASKELNLNSPGLCNHLDSNTLYRNQWIVETIRNKD